MELASPANVEGRLAVGDLRAERAAVAAAGGCLQPVPATGDASQADAASCGRALPCSFRDPTGFVFRRGDAIFRQIDRGHESDYRRLMSSGLYDRLLDDGLLLPHEEVSLDHAANEQAAIVLRPLELPLVSYPYEWCFGQLRQAALATLRIQRAALQYGLWLKDASAYNIQWAGGQAVLMDTLSLARYPQGRPWVAFRQFCRHFLAPLALMAHRDVRLGQLLRAHIDGLPLDLVSRLLPWHTWLRPGLAMHLHWHARWEKRLAEVRRPGPVPAPRRAGYAPWNDRAVGEAGTGIPSRAFSLRSLEALIDSLQGVIERLRWRCADSAWSDYYTSMHNYGAAGLAAKEECVAAYLDLAAPRTVWDLGANDGRFSRLASRRGAFTVAWDLDPVCVERNFLQAQSTGEKNLLPLLIDLTNPSPALGWAHAERQSLVERGPAELVLALGLIHHLAIGNNVPLERLASFLAALGRKLIIEFVPREDAQVQRMLSSREDIFGAYDRAGFESAFGRHFRIECSHPLPGVRRLYLMTRR